jgi:hypothetical protein
MDNPAADLPPTIGVLATDDDDIGWEAEVAEGAMKAHRLLGLIGDLRLDDEKIHIAAGTGLPAGMRTEENHL